MQKHICLDISIVPCELEVSEDHFNINAAQQHADTYFILFIQLLTSLRFATV